jgi:hypothetical protein
MLDKETSFLWEGHVARIRKKEMHTKCKFGNLKRKRPFENQGKNGMALELILEDV